MKAWWVERTLREKNLLVSAFVALVLMLGWAGVIHPLTLRQDALHARIQAQRNSLAQLQEARRLSETLPDATAPRADRAVQSLASAVEQGLRLAGLAAAIRRIEPAGPGELSVQLEQAAFDPLVQWLQKAATDPGAEVVELAIEPAEPAGTVNARLRLREGS